MLSPFFIMKFTWSKSGDSLEVVCKHNSLVQYWIEQLPSNKFIVKEDKFPYKSFDRLQESINKVNMFLKSKLTIDCFDYDEIVWNKTFLNQVHRDWADIQIKFKNLPIMLEQVGLLSEFYDINLAFHKIETSCKIKYVEQSSNTEFKHQIPGPPNVEQYLEHGRSQLSLEYWGLGRDNYNAWQMCDEVAYIDNFSMLPFTLDVNILKPYNSEYPIEYIQHMNDLSLSPVGSYMPIGSFKNYENIGGLYDIFLRNNKIDQTVILEI